MNNYLRRQSFVSMSTIAGLAAFGGCVSATAAAEPFYQFDIPPEPVAQALTSFSKVTSQQIIFSEDITAGQRSPRLHGRFTATDALNALLGPTNLKGDRNSSGVIMIRVKGSPPTMGAGGDSTPATAAVAHDAMVVRSTPRNDQPSSPSAGAPDGRPQQIDQRGFGHPTVENAPDLIVTASRVARAGFVAPTPTTVLTSDDLAAGGATNLGAALTALPSYAPTLSPATTRASSPGINVANLRDLGQQRTLVLIDGSRPVATSPNPFAFDLNMVPFDLVKRVDVVTGGASAQWGSDAVAGVINIVMDDSFTGFKAKVQDGGDTEAFGSNEYKVSAAFGANFDGGRGHIMFGGGYDSVRGVYPASRTPSGSDGLIPNPNYTSTNGQSQYLFERGLLNNNASTGGLITSGPLKGTTFGPGGSVGSFQYGQYGLLPSSGSLMVGGDPSARLYLVGLSFGGGAAIAPLTTDSFYSRATYELNSHVTLMADVLLGRTSSNEALGTDTYLGTITIQNTNAYLPAQIVSAMASNKIKSFTLGRVNQDFGPFVSDLTDDTQMIKLGAKGDLPGTWTWDSFYSFGETERHYTVGNQPIIANFANSVNAIKSPTTGQPICAVALTNPASTCVPVDLFGQGSPSAAALAYFEGNSVQTTYLYQQEAAANLRGEPFSSWAGPVSVAAGLEFRDESVSGYNDALTQAGAFAVANQKALSPGSYTVTEGYLETVAPLVRGGPLMQKLDFNGAVRVSGYSTSGVLPSWKIGLTDSVTNDFLVRGTYSRDIRAPNLQELHTQQSQGPSTVLNPANNTSYSIEVYNGGNPNLKAETATTWTFGTVYQPSFIPGLGAAIDYYNIDIENAITTLTAQTIVNQCYTGHVSGACSEITTSGGAITAVQGTYINLASLKASGVDFEADYARSLSDLRLPGGVKIKWLATYINTLKQYTGTTVVALADSLMFNGSGGLPRWRSTLTAKYALDPLAVTIRARYVGGGQYTQLETVNTRVPATTYWDLGLEWRLPTARKVFLYGDVNNVGNEINVVGAAANAGLFDNIGRVYDVGIRLDF